MSILYRLYTKLLWRALILRACPEKKMKFVFLLLTVVTAIELTPDNWDEETTGKTVFIKMFAPWCGHCKAMKPDWDRLMEEYAESETTLVADVDCINGGKEICDNNNVKGFPTIKYGSANSLEDYKGGRSASDLREFASKLGPPCNVYTLENCNNKQKAQIEEYQGKNKEVLEGMITSYENSVADIESTFKTGVDGLNVQFKQLQDDKEIALGKLDDVGIVRTLLSKDITGVDTGRYSTEEGGEL